MQDFSSVVSWIFAQVNSVLDLISQYFILRLALFVPIAGAAMVVVYYLLQQSDIDLITFKKNRDVGLKSYAFGSAYSLSLKNGNKSRLIGMGKPVKLSSASHSLVYKKRRKKAQIAADKKREEERNKWRQEWQNKLKAEQASREYYDSHHKNHSGSLNIDVD